MNANCWQRGFCVFTYNNISFTPDKDIYGGMLRHSLFSFHKKTYYMSSIKLSVRKRAFTKLNLFSRFNNLRAYIDNP